MARSTNRTPRWGGRDLGMGPLYKQNAPAGDETVYPGKPCYGFTPCWKWPNCASAWARIHRTLLNRPLPIRPQFHAQTSSNLAAASEAASAGIKDTDGHSCRPIKCNRPSRDARQTVSTRLTLLLLPWSSLQKWPILCVGNHEGMRSYRTPASGRTA